MRKFMVVVLGVVFAVVVFAVPNVEAKTSLKQLKRQVKISLDSNDPERGYLRVAKMEMNDGLLDATIWVFAFPAKDMIYEAGERRECDRSGAAIGMGGVKSYPVLVNLPRRSNEYSYYLKMSEVGCYLKDILRLIDKSGIPVNGYVKVTSSEVQLEKVWAYLKTGEWIRAQAQLDELKREFHFWEQDIHFRTVGNSIMNGIILSRNKQIPKQAEAKGLYDKEMIKDAPNNMRIHGYRWVTAYWDMQLLTMLYDRKNVSFISQSSWNLLYGKKNFGNILLANRSFDKWKQLLKTIIFVDKGGKSSRLLTRK